MLIEKRSFFSGMDGDSSPRLLDDKSCLNIMNGRLTVTEYGRYGRVENSPGTYQVPQSVFPPYGVQQTIGSCPDLDNSRLLFFNYNSFDDHGIYCYDVNTNTLYAVLYDSQVIGGLGFSRDSLIHSARVENGCLYWCEGTSNEPRRININAGIETNHPGTFSDVDPYSWPMSQSVLYWIRRQPGLPLTSVKDEDTDFENNFIKNEAFQFAWRYIYRDYEISTLSAWSLLQNYNQLDDDNNYIIVTAPLGETIEQDVIQVDLVVKYLNGGKCFVVKSWNKAIQADRNEIIQHNLGNAALTFDFYNDVTGIALDDAYSVKPYDSVPIYAWTIEMAKNRSFMANYVIGYDTPSAEAQSLNAFRQEGNSTTTYGQWIKIVWGFSGTSEYWFLEIPGLGYFDVSPQPTPPPWPTPVDYATELTHVADTPEEFAGYVQDHFVSWINGIQYEGGVSQIDNAPSPPALAGQTAFKSGASYQASIHFLDHAGRKCGIITNDNLKLNVPEREYDQLSYTTGINWSVSNSDAINQIPEWAYYYSVNITKCLSTRFFVQSKVRNITYVTKDADGLYVYNTSAYAADLIGVGVDITMLNSYGMGYTFADGDLIKIYIDGDATVYNLSIIAQDGNWVVCELQDLGALGATGTPKLDVLFQIYTPYKPSTSEPYFEAAQIFEINNPTTSSREYSTLAGQFRGDITILTRNDGTDDYLTENMSPNDKFPYVWNTDAGRPNFIDSIGQQVKTNDIAYSNTFIQGSKTNGLSTYDALDTQSLPAECGDIKKLQVANKIAEEGNIMLSICQHQTVSMYLGEVQLVGASQNAFVAQAVGVIGSIYPLKGSKGTENPESVFEHEGLVFWMDILNGEFIQYSANGLEPVSRYKMARFFKRFSKDYLATSDSTLDAINGFHHIRACIDPFHKEVLVTTPATIFENYATNLPSYSSVPSYATSIIDRFDIYDKLGKTMSFQFEENKWGSNYEYMSEWMDYIQNTLFGFKNGYLYIHNRDTVNWNRWYGEDFPVRICTTGNLNPSLLKDLFNIAVEASDIPDFTVAMTQYPNTQITDLADDDYVDQESVLYATFLRDRLSPNASGTADEKLYTGDGLKDFAIMVMCEWQKYDSLFWCQFINFGYSQSKGQQNITTTINS